MQLLELAARLDSELVDEDPAPLLVRLERFGLATRAVEREHVLPAQPLPDGMLLDETLELAHKLGMARRVEVRLYPFLERREPKLLEVGDVRLRKSLKGEVGERRPAPERRASRNFAARSPGSAGSCVVDQAPETGRGRAPRAARSVR